MDDLPDDVLAYIFSFAEAGTLLRELRAVCRRWRRLALHPDAWRHRSSNCCGRMRAPFLLSLMKLLTLAPCLHELEIATTSFPVDAVRELALVATNTPCAVRILDLYETRKHFMDVMPAVVRNQARLGRLRCLRLSAPDDSSQLWEMLEAVADLDLDYLDLSIYNDAVYAAPPGPWGKGTLKGLELATQLSDPVFEFLVRNRATSLESVEFYSSREFQVSPVPWVAALASCSKLESAIVPAVAEVASLAKCPSLTTLRIVSYYDESVTEEHVDDISAVVAYSFRKATQLTYLSFLTDSCDHLWLTGTGVVSALARSGASKLGTLSLAPIHKASELDELLLALPGLPCLHTLRMESFPSAEFLAGLTASAVPRLTVVDISCWNQCVRLCLVRAAHSAVQQNSKLHVRLDCSDPFCANLPGYGVYGHHPSEECSYHDSYAQWQWVGV